MDIDPSTDGLRFIAQIHAEFPKTPIYLMSYASLVYTPGIETFCKKAADAGMKGMIIPDLPFDFDASLSAACAANGMLSIPVAAPSMSADRLHKLAPAGGKSGGGQGRGSALAGGTTIWSSLTAY